jgi:hypothetical protein
LRRAVEAARFFDGDVDLQSVPLACWSLVHGLASLVVDRRLAEKDAGPPEAIATRLTRLLIDALAALADVKHGRRRIGSTRRTQDRIVCADLVAGKKATTMIGGSAHRCSPE